LRLSGWCRAVPGDVAAAVPLGLRHYNLSISTSDQMISRKFRGRLDRESVISEMVAAVRAARDGGAQTIGVNAEDGSRTDEGFLLEFATAAREAGADRVRYCDTIGGETPDRIRERFAKLAAAVAIPVELRVRPAAPAEPARGGPQRLRSRVRHPRRRRAPPHRELPAPARAAVPRPDLTGADELAGAERRSAQPPICRRRRMSFSRRRCAGSSIRYIPVGMPIARMITPMASHGLTMNKMRPRMIPAMANFIRPDNFCLLRRRGCGSRPAGHGQPVSGRTATSAPAK
ncbi:MAG: hypothetical protein ACRDND_28325, partial [Streptosporangiaceae bacterium]